MAARSSSLSANTATGGQKIAILRTNPESILLHSVEDHELEALVNMTRPYSLSLSMLAMGGAIGLLPAALDDVSKAGRGLSISDLVVLGAFVGCVVSAIILGVFAFRGLSDARAAVKRIRSRPTTPA